MIETFSSIDPSETVVLLFDFADGFPAPETITSVTAVSTVYSGIDASAGAFVKQHSIAGEIVSVTVGTGVNNVTYKIKVTVVSANRTLVLYGKILVHEET